MCELNKVEAMELIKGIVGSKVCAMYYNKKKGISSKSKKIGKRRVEKNIQNAKTITYSGSEYIRKIELHGNQREIQIFSMQLYCYSVLIEKNRTKVRKC